MAGSFLHTSSTSGIGFVGGAWYGLLVYLRVSERNLNYYHTPNIRYSNVGGRGCR